MNRLIFLLFFCTLQITSGFCKSQVIILNEENWEKMLKGEWMVEFYAPWCPACKNLAPTWDDFSNWSDDLGIQTAKIDVTLSPALSGRFLVTALPTIFHVLEGEFRQYKGSRDINTLMSFIEDKKWETLEKVSAWKSPDSVQMSVVSYFFKLSHFLKELNNMLLKEYGLPAWGSYALFAVATILLGAILGLLLVCVIDLLFPPKHTQRSSFSDNKKQDDLTGDSEEIRGDELEDEDEDEQVGSDREKFSGSDSEAPESDKKSPPGSPKQGGDGPAIRSRKTRKAD